MAEATQKPRPGKNPAFDPSPALASLESAASGGKLTPGAVANVRRWLTEPRYAEYAANVARHLHEERWKELESAFWTVLPFGTGGRRGRMYEIGSNAINDRTIGESAQGLAEYVRQYHEERGGGELRCAIAYDTRHNSRHFAELCAGIMVASGFRVYFLDDYRSTPELSFLVRKEQCACGIMVTASHNPPSDNAVKVYWSSGGQILPPHDKAIIDRVMNAGRIAHAPYATALADGRVVVCTKVTDAAYLREVRSQAFPGPRDLRIIYSPLHGVGEASVRPALEADGFSDIEIFAPHRQPDGDFPNVPGHVSNPENPEVFAAIIERARQIGADLILATDPDCDRVGAAAPLTLAAASPWGTFTGNHIGALLADYVLERRREAGTLTPQHYLVKTLVTSELIRRIGQSHGVPTHGNLHVGFKWIGGLIDDEGPDGFVLGLEESHGYLVGQYARDKDGAVAAMLLAEVAARVKADGKSLHEKLDALYWQHGCHVERQMNQSMEGATGMERMKALMARLRECPPETLGELEVAAVRDYQNLVTRHADGTTKPLVAPRGDMVVIDLVEEGNYAAVRPSGTEPKVKFYTFGYIPAEALADLVQAKGELTRRLEAIERDLAEIAASV
jgi:phosphomannomutase